MVLLIFLVPVLFLLHFSVVKKTERRFFHIIPVAYLISMEVYWGQIVNDYLPLGSIVSSLIVATIYFMISLFVKTPMGLSLTAFMAVAAGSIYYISFDVYYSFFNDYPSISMYGHAAQVLSILDSIPPLIGKSHMAALALGVLYLVIIVWNLRIYERTIQP